MLERKKIDWGSTNIEWNNNSIWNNIIINNNFWNTKSNEKNKEVWIIKQSFIDSIEKLEFAWFTLSKIFVWPEFYFISWEEEKNIDWSLNSFLEEKNKSCFIKWIDLSWKTSVWKKIFLESLSKKYHPILLNWNSIIKWNVNFDNIIQKEITDQYNCNLEDYKCKENKLIIVDNYHIWINKKFIEFCKENFFKTIFIISDDDFVMYFKDDENYIDFDIYSINTFNNSKKHDLIYNWLKKDYQIEDEVYNKHFDSLEDKINDSNNHTLPMYPFYLLSVIQAFDNVITRDLTLTSYWHCYFALLIYQLDKKWIDSREFEYCFNFLKHLAYYIYELKWYNFDYITIEEYIRFKNEYNNSYTMMNKTSLNKLENDVYSIYRNRDWKIKFELEYIFYYFVWKFIADEENNIKIIEKLSDTIYKKSSSNILIFAIHHTSNIKLLEEIQLHCVTIFDTYNVNLLSNEDTDFLNTLVNELPESILSGKSISENRKNEQKVKDNNKNYKEFTDTEIEENKELLELSKAFKIIEVLWQILKNRSWSLKKNQLEELLFDIENLWLRLMSYLLEMIKSDDFSNSIERMIDLYEEKKRNKYLSDSDKKKHIEKFIQNMWLRTIIWILFKIFQSVNIEQLLELQRSITKKNQHPSYELLYSLFNLNYWKLKQQELKNLFNKFKDEKNNLALKTLSFFIQIYMNNHYIEHNERQSLHSLLWIKKYLPNKVSKEIWK